MNGIGGAWGVAVLPDQNLLFVGDFIGNTIWRCDLNGNELTPLVTGMETPRGPVPGSVESLAYGFGLALVRFKGIVETLNVACTTPIDDEHVHVRFAFSVNKSAGANVAKGVGAAFVKEVSRQLGQDIPIWENKVQHKQPLLCDGDGPIGMFRRWCEQFYAAPQQEAAAE